MVTLPKEESLQEMAGLGLEKTLRNLIIVIKELKRRRV